MEGARILDVGGESTRPGADPVSGLRHDPGMAKVVAEEGAGLVLLRDLASLQALGCPIMVRPPTGSQAPQDRAQES